MPVTNQALAGGYQLLNYRIDRQISRGGFSIVYRAFDEEGAPIPIAPGRVVPAEEAPPDLPIQILDPERPRESGRLIDQNP